jgi:hypothetical protein
MWSGRSFGRLPACSLHYHGHRCIFVRCLCVSPLTLIGSFICPWKALLEKTNGIFRCICVLSIGSDIYVCSNKSLSHCTWSSVLFVENAREHKLITVNRLVQCKRFARIRITSAEASLIFSRMVYQSDTSILCSDGVCSFFSWKENFVFTRSERWLQSVTPGWPSRNGIESISLTAQQFVECNPVHSFSFLFQWIL